MISLDIDIPEPSRFVSNEAIDEIALQANKVYREKTSNTRGYPVDMDLFIDMLEVSICREEIEEPEGATFFANFCPEDGGIITINQKHNELFESRPDVYGACLAHEGGHCILRHCEKFAATETAPLLYEELTLGPQLFHKSSKYQYGLTREEVQKQIEFTSQLRNKLAKVALVSDTARQTLVQMNDHFEPDWMFYQAEHFSRCLRIPLDQLMPQLEEGWDFTSWAPCYRLGERFGVSGSMMRTRLIKLNVMGIGPDGKPYPKLSKQAKLIH
jgi:hypothetical protein